MFDTQSAEELFMEITGCDYRDKIALLKLYESIKIKPHVIDNPQVQPSCSFEHAWENSKVVESNQVENISIPVEPAQA